MLFEDMLLVCTLVIGFFLVVLPAYKLIRSLFPHRRDPVKEARERLRIVKIEAETLRINKETEKLYEETYLEGQLPPAQGWRLVSSASGTPTIG